MRLGADVLIELKLQRAHRGRGRTPQGAGSLHGAPWLPRPLQGPIWGARVTGGGELTGMWWVPRGRQQQSKEQK